MKMINVCTNCQVVETEKGNVIFSYGTPVFSIYDTMGGVSMGNRRLWSGWSATTQRHINKALDLYGLHHISKAKWAKMPVFDCKL